MVVIEELSTGPIVRDVVPYLPIAGSGLDVSPLLIGGKMVSWGRGLRFFITEKIRGVHFACWILEDGPSEEMGPEDLGLTDGSCVVLRHPSWSREIALFPPRDDLNLHSRFLPNELKLGRSSVDPNLEIIVGPRMRFRVTPFHDGEGVHYARWVPETTLDLEFLARDSNPVEDGRRLVVRARSSVVGGYRGTWVRIPALDNLGQCGPLGPRGSPSAPTDVTEEELGMVPGREEIVGWRLVSTDNFLLRLVWGSYGNLRVPEWMIGVDEPDALVAVWESCAPAVPDPSWTKLEFLSTCLPLEEGASNRIVKLQGYPRWDVVLPHRRTCHEPLPQNGSGYRPDKPLTGGQEGKRFRVRLRKAVRKDPSGWIFLPEYADIVTLRFIMEHKATILSGILPGMREMPYITSLLNCVTAMMVPEMVWEELAEDVAREEVLRTSSDDEGDADYQPPIEDRGHVLGYNLPECRVVLTRLPEVGSGSGRASGIEVIDLTCSDDDAEAVGTVEVGPRTEMQPGSSGGRGATGGRNHQVQYSGPVSSEEEEDLEALFVKVKRVRKEKKSSTGAGEETERSANQAGGSGRVMAEGKTRIKARSKKWFRRRCPCVHVFIAMDRWRYHLKNCNGGSCNPGRCHLIGCQGNPNPEVDYRRRR
ncbi:hypothetical protein Fcan01_21133 [Folsomia candida]|uniref:Uncharacterized protein n=1 Tax=Folsomia candida TaxID=158441 RepID=A0A226DEB8_FOLCA|nr:hypothetical protein Fcan01_21133 [Folsomia candida]